MAVFELEEPGARSESRCVGTLIKKGRSTSCLLMACAASKQCIQVGLKK
jgi:hypothetical protein